MFKQQDVIYLYDGGFDGFLCCVFESFLKKETPFSICPAAGFEPVLFESRLISTDFEKAGRVRSWLNKLPFKARWLAQLSFLSSEPQKDVFLLQFLQLCETQKETAAGLLQCPCVLAVNGAATAVNREAEKWMGFLRFSDHEGFLAAVFEPQNNVLPLLMGHFCDRFSCETFLIYDALHKIALVSENGKGRCFPLDEFHLAPDTAEEAFFQALFRQFYRAIAIEPRKNEKLRQSHLPKKYRGNMLEFSDSPHLAGPQKEKPELL